MAKQYTAEEFEIAHRRLEHWGLNYRVGTKHKDTALVALRIAAAVMRPGFIYDAIKRELDVWMLEPMTPDEPHSLKRALDAAVRKALTDG